MSSIDTELHDNSRIESEGTNWGRLRKWPSTYPQPPPPPTKKGREIWINNNGTNFHTDDQIPFEQDGTTNINMRPPKGALILLDRK